MKEIFSQLDNISRYLPIESKSLVADGQNMDQSRQAIFGIYRYADIRFVANTSRGPHQEIEHV
jgi:hypothetical protein